MLKYRYLLSLLVLIPVFSLPQDRIKADYIIKKLNDGKDIRYENVEITGDLDFTLIENFEFEKKLGSSTGVKQLNGTRKWTYTFEEKTAFHVKNPVVFSNCTFRGKLIAYKEKEEKDGNNIIVRNAVIKFHENVIFENCLFRKDVIFKNSEFVKQAEFYGSKFYGKSIFEECGFNYPADFSNIEFGDTNFEHAKFSNGVSFENSRFKNKTNFKNTLILSPLNIKSVDFRKNVDFNTTVFNDEPFNWYLIDNRDKFSEAFLKKIKPPRPLSYCTATILFEGCEVSSDMDVMRLKDYNYNRVLFWDAEVELKSLSGTWRLRGRIEWYPEEKKFISRKATLILPDEEKKVEAEEIALYVDDPVKYKILESSKK